jgi:hypothetical protein
MVGLLVLIGSAAFCSCSGDNKESGATGINAGSDNEAVVQSGQNGSQSVGGSGGGVEATPTRGFQKAGAGGANLGGAGKKAGQTAAGKGGAGGRGGSAGAKK